MKPKKVYLFVFNTLADWEYGYAVAGINNPQFQKNSDRYKVVTVGATTDSVITAGGIRITPDESIDKVVPADSAMLILPGGASWDEGENGEAADLAAQFLNHKVPVAAICGATAGLAKAGLLDKTKHTSNALDYLAATGYKGAKHYVDAPAVRDGNLITASAMSPVDFAKEIFSCLGIYDDAVLNAWYGLFKTGDAKYFQQLMKAGRAE
jgi:putative intracellular protease/amidase